jgi:hypothetical protein
MPTTFKSLLTRFFGSGTGGGPKAPSVEPTEYKGYRITPAPYPAKGQYQTAGLIQKDFESGRKEHRFVRAETHPTMEDAASFALAKGKQIIDEQGDRIFS